MPTAKISTLLTVVDAQGNKSSFATNPPTMELAQYEEQNITLQPNTYFLPVPFPAGLTLAKFVWVSPLTVSDLKVSQVYDGQAAIPVPMGYGQFLLQAAGLWVSSIMGGAVQIVMGG